MGAEVSLRLRLQNRAFGRKVREAKGDLRGIGKVAKSVGRSTMRGLGRALDRIATPGAIASSLGLGLVARELVDIEDRLAGVQNNADATDESILALRQHIMDLSGGRTGQLAGDLLGAAESLLAADSSLMGTLTGTDLLERLGVAATATGSDVRDLAETAFQLHNAFDLPWDQVGTQLDVLATLGKAGAFELKDMARHMPQVGASMSRIGQVGPEGLARTAAMLQIVRRDTAEASTAANNLVNAISFLQSETGSKRLRKLGVNVFDDQGQMRDLFVLLEEISALTEGGSNQALLSQIFSDRQAREGMQSLVTNLDDLQRLSRVQPDGGILDADAERRISSTAGQLKELKTVIVKIADQHMGPWLDRLQGLLEWINDHPGVVDKALKAGAAVVGLAAARKLWRGLKDTFSFGGGGAGPLGSGGKPIPVEVVNWGGVGGAGELLGGAGQQALGTAAGRSVGSFLAGLGRSVRTLLTTNLAGLTGARAVAGAGAVGVAGAAGYAIGTAINENLSDQAKSDIQITMAGLAGMLGNEEAQRLVDQSAAPEYVHWAGRQAGAAFGLLPESTQTGLLRGLLHLLGGPSEVTVNVTAPDGYEVDVETERAIRADGGTGL